MKEEKLLLELVRQRDDLEARIKKGRQIISDKRNEERLRLVLEQKSKIDKDVWDSWLLKLLQNMEFEGLFYGDSVSIGVDGKRPFGNSNSEGDIARILGWEYEDDLSDSQYLLVRALWKDLPDFLNNLIKEGKND